MPANNRVLATNRQKLFSTVILDLDFTSLAAGSYSPYINFKTPCASSSRTVQTGKSTVTSNINADDALIGREQDWWDLGLVVEGPVTNAWATPRLSTNVSLTGDASLLAAAGAGTDSPDATQNACVFGATATGLAYYNNTLINSSFSYWCRRYSGNVPRRGVLYKPANIFVYSLTSGTMSSVWERQKLTLSESTNFSTVAALVDSRATYFGSIAASNGRFDMYQVESGVLIPHEFYEGSKLGGGLTIDASKVIVNGRLSMYWKGRPKGSVNGNNPWTYNPWIVGKDANNNILFDAITGFVSVTILGLTYTTTIPINFSRGSMVEIWVEAGGTKLNTVVKTKIDGIITTLGISTSPQGYFPNDGLLGICCNPLNLTTSQFESWINRVVFYTNNVIPDTFATDPYQMFYDFTGLTVGSPATPSGLTFTCATAGRTVQTSDSTVVSGIAANAIRVGKENSKWMNGMVLEGAVTNLLPTPRLLTPTGTGGWNAAIGTEVFTGQSAGTDSPDGTVNSASIDILSGTIGRYKGLTSASATALSLWRKQLSVGSVKRAAIESASTAPTHIGETGNITTTWSKSMLIGGANGIIAPFEGRVAGPYAGAAACSAKIDFVSAENNRVPHEFIDGTKATETLSVPVSSAVVNGRLGFYCRFRPKFSSTGGSNVITYNPRLWQSDSNNVAILSVSGANALILVIGGVTRTSVNAMPLFARGDDVQIWMECGNGEPLVWMSVNSEPIVVMVFATGANAAITGSTLTIYSDTAGSSVVEAWHATFRTYKPGLRPDWQDPNILWTADFTKLQAGTDTKPAGMTVLCATAARTVQVGDNAVVSAIAADVPLIGRENNTWNLGAVLEGAVSNAVSTGGRTLVGGAWGAGTATFTAQTTGINSPDNTVTSPRSNGTADQYSAYLSLSGNTPAVISLWRNSSSPGRILAQNAGGSGGTVSSTPEAGSGTGTWVKTSQIYSTTSTGGSWTIIPCEGRANGGYASTSANDSYLDFIHIEIGNIPHEFITTSKAGTVHSIPAATIVSSNRLSLTYTMRPKGSISGTNPWTTSVYLWRQDASNYCEITTAGIFNSVIAGSSQSSSTGITFSRGDRIEWWYAGGGGTLATIIKARVNGGAIQTFTLPIQGTIPNSGTIGLGCNWNAPSTNSFEGWYEFIAAYVTGTSPTWAA